MFCGNKLPSYKKKKKRKYFENRQTTLDYKKKPQK